MVARAARRNFARRAWIGREMVCRKRRMLSEIA